MAPYNISILLKFFFVVVVNSSTFFLYFVTKAALLQIWNCHKLRNILGNNIEPEFNFLYLSILSS